MNILHTETLKRWGGQQNRVLTEASGLIGRGHRVVIACHRGSILAQKAKEAVLPVYEVNMVKQNHLLTIPRLMRIIIREKVDIVSTHSSVDSWAGGIAAKLTGRRLVRFRHNLFPIGRDPLTRLIYTLPDRIITLSRAIEDVLREGGIGKEKISVIPSCVDAERFTPAVEDLREELHIDPGILIIGNTSTFSQVKGYESLLRAFNRIGREVPCILLFAGSIEEEGRKRCLGFIEENLRDRVLFLGHRDDVPRVLKTIDVFVYPSFMEGLGTALLEAMTMKRAIALSDIPTFREFIDDTGNGLFFAAQDPDDMAEKVLLLLRDEGLRQRLGEHARSTALERFSPGRMLDLTETTYREVLNAS